MLACKSFKKSSLNLYDSLATLARQLCTEFVDPLTVEPVLASWLIPLNKGKKDVRPIGVGEVIRRIIGKGWPSKISILLRLAVHCKSGSEAAIHAMHKIFEAHNTDAVLLIDASNAFNSLNRATALHSVKILCPTIATYAIKTYRETARPFINPGGLPCYVSLRSKSSAITSTLECLYVRKAVLVRRWRHRCWFLGGTEEMVRCTKRIGTDLRIFSQWEKVLAYCEARDRRGSGIFLVKDQLTAPLWVKSI